MLLNKYFRTLIIASVYFVSGAFFVTHAEVKDPKSPGKLDATPAPMISRSSADLQTHSFGIGVGQTFLYSQFDEFGEDKITVDLYYNYVASHTFDFMANFHVQSHEFKGGKTELSGLALAIKAKAYQIDSFSPFAFAGLGFYNPRLTRLVDGVYTQSSSNLIFGINFGVGGQLKLNKKFSVGVIAHYHDPFDIKQEVGPKVEGNYYKLLMTSFYTF